MKFFFTLLVVVVLYASSYAQVGIGTNTPDPSASLDITSTTAGFVPPRLTAAQRDAIPSPVAGLQLWCTNCGANGEMQVYNGTSWTNLLGAPAAEPPTLQIGDEFAGGIIFYLDGNGGGKVCALQDQSTGILQWALPAYHFETVPGTGATSNTDGSANTDAIIEQTQADPADTYAAGLCRLYSTPGNNDLGLWYLPSKDELNQMYENIGQGNELGLGNIGNFASDGFYWSSTEFNLNNAWIQIFPLW